MSGAAGDTATLDLSGAIMPLDNEPAADKGLTATSSSDRDTAASQDTVVAGSAVDVQALTFALWSRRDDPEFVRSTIDLIRLVHLSFHS